MKVDVKKNGKAVLIVRPAVVPAAILTKRKKMSLFLYSIQMSQNTVNAGKFIQQPKKSCLHRNRKW
jgi:hypothetical protein